MHVSKLRLILQFNRLRAVSVSPSCLARRASVLWCVRLASRVREVGTDANVPRRIAELRSVGIHAEAQKHLTPRGCSFPASCLLLLLAFFVCCRQACVAGWLC